MTDRELMEALSAYTAPGVEKSGGVRKQVMEAIDREKWSKQRNRRRFLISAAAVAVCVLFLQTPPGTAVAAAVQEQMDAFVELILGPKLIPLSPEGIQEALEHQAAVQAAEDDKPGYAIWVDEERYEYLLEEGVGYIRPHGWEDLPEYLPSLCEMIIQNIPDTTPQQAAEDAKAVLAEEFGAASQIEEIQLDEETALQITAGTEVNGDSSRARVVLVDDKCGGTYQITIRYFLEAEEGHGARFDAMLQTFMAGNFRLTGEEKSAP